MSALVCRTDLLRAPLSIACSPPSSSVTLACRTRQAARTSLTRLSTASSSLLSTVCAIDGCSGVCRSRAGVDVRASQSMQYGHLKLPVCTSMCLCQYCHLICWNLTRSYLCTINKPSILDRTHLGGCSRSANNEYRPSHQFNKTMQRKFSSRKYNDVPW